MTDLLPDAVCDVFDRFTTAEYTTVEPDGQPITWPVTPYHHRDEGCIDVTPGLGYPEKARDARANPKVALLFSDPTSSGLEDPPMVLVQGVVKVDREAPRHPQMHPSKVHVRPERVYVWPSGDVTAEPQLLDSHMEEVRSGHHEEPDVAHDPPRGGARIWDEPMEDLGERYPSAVLSLVAPDGFPFSVRVPIEVDRSERLVRIGAGAVGVPVQPGLACLVAHDHDPESSHSLLVRGDLVERGGDWVLVPHELAKHPV